MISLKADFMFRAVLGLQQNQVETTESTPPLHTNSPIHTSHYSAIVHSMGFHKCIMSVIHHYSIRQISSNAPKFFWAQSIHTFLHLISGNHDLFTAVIVLSFPEFQIVGIIQNIAFSDWLLSFRNKHSFHVFSWHNSSFAFNTE